MNDNERYHELLIKYLVNELNSEEKAFIENWIDANEKNKQYFEEFQGVWNLTGLTNGQENLHVGEEWLHFKQTVTSKDTRVIPVKEITELRAGHGEDTPGTRRAPVYRRLISVAIAASFILIIGLGWKFLVRSKHESTVATNTRKVESPLFVIRHEVNNSGKERRIDLPDGSLVVLANESEITYRHPFTSSRDIALIGKAFFKVAKDNNSPFIVTSGAISTTALGTVFTVTAFRNAKQIVVRLYEGKVVIKAVDTAGRKLKNDVYLVPGQKFIYGNLTTAQVRTFHLKAAAPEQIMTQEIPQDSLFIPESSGTPFFMFNNQLLSEVLDNVASLYNVEIVYNKDEVRNIYFTGKYNKSDSLEIILQRIGILNNLTITKKANAFIIKK